MSGADGVAGTVREAVSGVAAGIARDRAAAEGEQLEAFELPSRFDAPTPAIERAKRQRGRPLHAQNRMTVKMREYLLAHGVDPLLALGRWSLHSPESLAAELGCSKLEAFREWRALQEALAPYFASRMVPIDDQGKPVPFLQMNVGGMVITPQAGAEPPWIAALRQIEQNQSLTHDVAPVSHGAVSHASEKPA